MTERHNFTVTNGDDTDMILEIKKSATAEDLEFYKQRIIEHIDHWIKNLQSVVTEKRGRDCGQTSATGQAIPDVECVNSTSATTPDSNCCVETNKEGKT